jgi:hypothetical protein
LHLACCKECLCKGEQPNLRKASLVIANKCNPQNLHTLLPSKVECLQKFVIIACNNLRKCWKYASMNKPKRTTRLATAHDTSQARHRGSGSMHSTQFAFIFQSCEPESCLKWLCSSSASRLHVICLKFHKAQLAVVIICNVIFPSFPRAQLVVAMCI